MGEEYVPRDATCLTDRGLFSRAFEKFKKACEKCENIESKGDTNYNVDNFKTL